MVLENCLYHSEDQQLTKMNLKPRPETDKAQERRLSNYENGLYHNPTSTTNFVFL